MFGSVQIYCLEDYVKICTRDSGAARDGNDWGENWGADDDNRLHKLPRGDNWQIDDN